LPITLLLFRRLSSVACFGYLVRGVPRLDGMM
jgi:hypothetical protein